MQRETCQATGEKKLQLPVFIGAFADAMIEESEKQNYHMIIVQVMLQDMCEWYARIHNTTNEDY